METPRQRKTVLTRELDDEIVLFQRDTGKSIHLNRTAGIIWYFCDGGHSEEQICLEVMALFPAEDAGRLRTEVQDTLQRFRDEALLE
jgi:hypothetical protein